MSVQSQKVRLNNHTILISRIQTIMTKLVGGKVIRWIRDDEKIID